MSVSRVVMQTFISSLCHLNGSFRIADECQNADKFKKQVLSICCGIHISAGGNDCAMPAKKYKYAYRKTLTLADGKRHDICANTKGEFEEKLLEVQLLTKQGIVPTDMTVAEFAKIWFKTYKDGANLRLNSKASIKNTVNNHILPYIGELRIDSVKPLHIQRIMNEANKLCNSTSSKVLAAMRSIFNAAVDNNLIAKSPVGITLKAGGTPTPKKSTLDK